MQRNTVKTFKEQKKCHPGEDSAGVRSGICWIGAKAGSTFCCRNSTAKPKKCILGLVIQGSTIAF